MNVADHEVRKLINQHLTLLGQSVLALAGPLPQRVRELVVDEQTSIVVFLRELDAHLQGEAAGSVHPDWVRDAASDLYRECVTTLQGSPGAYRIAEIIAAAKARADAAAAEESKA